MSVLLHAALGAVALLVWGPSAERAPAGGGRVRAVLVQPESTPAMPSPDPATPPEIETPPPPPEPPPEFAPREVLDDVPVTLEELPPLAEAPREEPPVVPPAPSLADAGRRVRARVSPPESPAAAPPLAAPSAADAPPAAPTARPALREIDVPHPPIPPSVPSGLTLTLWLDYTIAADGHILEARVTISSGYPDLDASTADFVLRRWRYQPPGADRAVGRWFVFKPRR